MKEAYICERIRRIESKCSVVSDREKVVEEEEAVVGVNVDNVIGSFVDLLHRNREKE